MLENQLPNKKVYHVSNRIDTWRVENYSLLVLTGSSKSFISKLGQSGLTDGSGLSRSQAHLSANCGESAFSSMFTTYFPITGKNLYPWKEPHVAT